MKNIEIAVMFVIGFVIKNRKIGAKKFAKVDVFVGMDLLDRIQTLNAFQKMIVMLSSKISTLLRNKKACDHQFQKFN
jgi:hypothetical protein